MKYKDRKHIKEPKRKRKKKIIISKDDITPKQKEIAISSIENMFANLEQQPKEIQDKFLKTLAKSQGRIDIIIQEEE